MKLYFTPAVFNNVARYLKIYRWRLLLWSALGFVLYLLLTEQIEFSTPNGLIWLTLFIVFASLQALVLSAFIFFFQELPSRKTKQDFWRRLYLIVEWSEAILFTILLPLPSLTFIYALLQ
ncbi:MAG: hypothetical protein ACSHW0_08945 [Thalassotalea sp.]